MTCELLKELLKKYNRESEWIEFKENNKEPHMIEYISALSNSAILHDVTKREHFGLEKKAHPKASKAISDTLSKGLIKPVNPENRSTKHIKYIPFYG